MPDTVTPTHALPATEFRRRALGAGCGEGRGTHLADRARRQAGVRRIRHPGAAGRPGEVRRGGGKARLRHGLSGGAEDRLAGHPAQDRSRRRGGRRAQWRRRAPGYETIVANAKRYKADARIDGVQVQQMLTGGQEVIVGAVTDRQLRQAGGVRHRWRAGRGAEGHHLPPRARDAGRRAVDARRHPGGGDAAAACAAAEPVDREALADMIVQRVADWSATSRRSPSST